MALKSVRACETQRERLRGDDRVWQLSASVKGSHNVCLTLSVSLQTEVHAAHTYSVPVGTCQRHRLATVPCLQLQQGLWTSWLANTAGIEQIMKPDIPSPPCPAPAVAKACYSSHKRCTIERLSLSLFHSPLILLFLPGPRSASRQGEMPTSPQSWAECPYPLCKWFTTSPTHTFIPCPPPSPTPPFLHLFLSPLTLQSLSC